MNNSFILAAYKSQLANFIQDSAAANVSQLVPSKVLTCNRTRAVARQPVPHLQKKYVFNFQVISEGRKFSLMDFVLLRYVETLPS